jgi:hypothetical protein
LLALIYPPKEIVDARHWIFSGRPDLRSNALEFLDSRLANPLRQTLLPVLEGQGARRIVESGTELFGLTPITYPSVVRRLLEWPDPWLQSCACYVAGEEGLLEFHASLRGLVAAADPILRETAARADERLKGAASAGARPPRS